MDINMPHMNGIECLEEIRKINADAIEIMCTADVQAKSTERAL
jgi:CheY-like chemotaxis protein